MTPAASRWLLLQSMHWSPRGLCADMASTAAGSGAGGGVRGAWAPGGTLHACLPLHPPLPICTICPSASHSPYQPARSPTAAHRPSTPRPTCVAARQRLLRVRHFFRQAQAVGAGLAGRPPVVRVVSAPGRDEERRTRRGRDLEQHLVPAHGGRRGAEAVAGEQRFVVLPQCGEVCWADRRGRRRGARGGSVRGTRCGGGAGQPAGRRDAAIRLSRYRDMPGQRCDQKAGCQDGRDARHFRCRSTHSCWAHSCRGKCAAQ